MSFLLDTNVISEPMKPRPNAGVLAWLAEVDEDSVFLSVVTITELRYVIERLATGRRRDHLDRWLRKDLTSRFGQRRIRAAGLSPEASLRAARWSRGTHSSLPPRKSTD